MKEAKKERNKRIGERSETEYLHEERKDPPKEEKEHIYSPDPLVWAVENEHWELFILLMERNNMDINKEDSEGRTAVTAAILNDRIEMLKEDLTKRTNFNSCQPGKLGTPLELAISHKNQAVLDVIMEHMSSLVPEQRDEEDVLVQDQTNLTVAERLIGRFVKLDIETFILAVYAEDVKVLEKLLRGSWRSIDIHTEIPNEIILNKGFKGQKSKSENYSSMFYLNLQNSFTLLSWSIWKGKKKLLDLLIQNMNKDVLRLSSKYLNDPVWGWWSPVTFQILRLNVEMLSFLIDLNIEFDVNLLLPNKFTPLTWTVFKGDQKMFEFLLGQNNIDVQRKDGWNSTPLSFAQNMNQQAMYYSITSSLLKSQQ